jgi:hypothetical protein
MSKAATIGAIWTGCSLAFRTVLFVAKAAHFLFMGFSLLVARVFMRLF